jgi:small subunit ribosomal protein S17
MASTEQAAAPVGHKNEKVGEVVSTNPVYKRIVTQRKKFYAHDEQGSAKVGDVVRIIECRPLSRLKRWQLGVVLRQAVQVTVDHPAIEGSADTRVKTTLKKKQK